MLIQHANSSLLRRLEHVDIVWDWYIDDCLKSTFRQRRGRAIPYNWKDALHLEDRRTDFGTRYDKPLNRKQCLHNSWMQYLVEL